MLDVMWFWLGMGSTVSGSTRSPIFTNAKAPTARTCPKPMSTSGVRRRSTRVPRAGAAGGGQPVAEDVVAYFGKGDECHMCFHF